MVATKLAFVVSGLLSAYLAFASGAQLVEHVSAPIEEMRR
jgi:hypothetical protein